jgi:hypothetical protein
MYEYHYIYNIRGKKQKKNFVSIWINKDNYTIIIFHSLCTVIQKSLPFNYIEFISFLYFSSIFLFCFLFILYLKIFLLLRLASPHETFSNVSPLQYRCCAQCHNNNCELSPPWYKRTRTHIPTHTQTHIIIVSR